MSDEIRQYLEEVVSTFAARFKRRGSSWGSNENIRLWEKRPYDKAKAILKANPKEAST